MRIAIAVALLSAGFAAAQEVCQAQHIVDACREGIQKQIDGCTGNDWICLCDNYTNLLTCYNNCPDSEEKPPVQNQVTQFCNAAEPLKSASASAAATQSPPESSGAASTGSPTSPSDSTAETSGSTGRPTSSPTGDAAPALMAPVGGVLAVVLGLAGVL